MVGCFFWVEWLVVVFFWLNGWLFFFWWGGGVEWLVTYLLAGCFLVGWLFFGLNCWFVIWLLLWLNLIKISLRVVHLIVVSSIMRPG